ncbi:hypothetical protein HQ47_05755 [Porphyromonas macacae]|uniref:Fimbrillin n=1 Tax=Porphyromonas macacae TaxID=28115 RepID=A0A0A2E5L3_9PORP|nr:fimbrial protein [Porphyromonas macacae]KGN74171.1 hypothetical protein HQ47_05755 [Porphyromonas macacae]SUB89944.1 Major fimbrial subunit protein type II [Porphyromonas macacae]
MKLTKYLLLGAAALSLAACNKEKEEISQGEKNASVSVRIASSNLLRLDQNESAKVVKLAAMIYNGEAQEAYKEVQNALEVKNIECVAGTRSLVVVANFGDRVLQGLSLRNLKALTEELQKDVQPVDLLMTSEIKEITLKEGVNKYGYDDPGDLSQKKPLELKRVHARAEFVSITQKMSPAFKKYKVDYTAVAALIAKKQSFVFGSPLVNAHPAYLYGIKTDKGSYTPADYEEAPSLKREYKGTGEDLADKNMGFYLIENNDGSHPTMLCLAGTLKNQDGSELSDQEKKDAFAAGWIVSETDATTYYPVLINWVNAKYKYEGNHQPMNSIVRNHYYKISLTITGPGTNKPEDEKKISNLDVKCKVVEWVTVGQNVTW